MAFAFAKYDGLSSGSLRKIFKRGILLYLTGFLLTAFPFYPAVQNPSMTFWQNWLDWFSSLRFVGVLPRIAMCYVLGSVLALWLKSVKKISWTIGILSLLHVGLLVLFPGPEGPFALEGNFAGRLDVAIFGENHIYHGYGIPFDPEGVLGVLTGTCTVLLGYLLGAMTRKGDSPVENSAKVFVISAAFLLAGLVMGIWIPISKPLWTVSYVFYTAGWASFVFAVLMYLIDVKGWEKPFFPFKALGMNALVLFVLSGLLMKIIWRYIHWDYTAIFGANELSSLLFSLIYMLFHLVIAVIMYRKKIFIKL